MYFIVGNVEGTTEVPRIHLYLVATDNKTKYKGMSFDTILSGSSTRLFSKDPSKYTFVAYYGTRPPTDSPCFPFLKGNIFGRENVKSSPFHVKKEEICRHWQVDMMDILEDPTLTKIYYSDHQSKGIILNPSKYNGSDHDYMIKCERTRIDNIVWLIEQYECAYIAKHGKSKGDSIETEIKEEDPLPTQPNSEKKRKWVD